MIAALSLTSYDSGLRGRLEDRLAPDALKRAGRFFFEEDRLRSMGAELLKRAILSGMANLPAAELAFGEEARGKPVLTNVSGLHFNLSHSGAWILMATGGRPLGVDVERVTDPAPEVEEVVFSGPEIAYLRALPEGERGPRFFDLWTRKESYIKALGMGFSAPITTISILPAGKEGCRPVAADDALDTDWWIRQLDLTPGYSAALCTREGRAPAIRRYDWEELLDLLP